jgi:hypothetical protein
MKSLKASAMDHSHYVRIHMTAKVPEGTTLEDVTTPTFWVNHVYRLKPGAMIEVIGEDNSLDCDLRVLEVGPTYAKVRVLRHYVEREVAKKANPAPAVDDGVKHEYANKTDRWRVVHNGEVIKSGFGTEADAAKAADEYRSKIAA